jgi:hypothetical protein
MLARKTYLDTSLDKLDENKKPFIKAVEAKIYLKIRQTSRLDCTAIVERTNQISDVVWRLTEPTEYARRFVHFIRADAVNRTFNGHELDSYLSNGIATIVQQEYTTYISDNVNEIGIAVMWMLAQDDLIMKALRRQVALSLKNSTTPLTNHAVDKMTEALMQGLMFNDAATTRLGRHISDAVGSATGDHIVTMVTNSLTGIIGTTIAQMIGRFLASTAGRQLLAIIVRKMAMKAVLTGVTTMLAAACGVAASGAVLWWVVLPVIVAFTAYEAYEFPQKLAEKVSKGVAEDLNRDLRTKNNELIQGMFLNLTKDGCFDFAEALANNDNVQQLAVTMCDTP